MVYAEKLSLFATGLCVLLGRTDELEMRHTEIGDPMQPKTERGCGDLWFLRQFNLPMRMSDDEMKIIASVSRMTWHRRGELIFLSGDPSDSIYFLKKGRIKLTGLSEDGHEVLLDVIGTGELFGEIGAIHEMPRTTSAETIEDSLLGEIRESDFETLLATHPKMSLQVLKRVGLRLKKVEARLLSFIAKNVFTRVEEALIDLLDIESTARSNLPFTIRLTQQDLANMIGASRQETSRALRQLENSGALQLKYRRIVITAPHKLRWEQISLKSEREGSKCA
ncbi:MAG TPA: Crp/Fnr family transcriptional regulator [Pyrinomonadaceae bacterium]|jgi:CRP-like cAMP-binding protein